jgi:anti-sigma factor RsiW
MERAMNADPRPHLADLLLRRELTPTEEGHLAHWLERHPEARADWQIDAAMSRQLRRLPAPAVHPHFTREVMEEIRRTHPPQHPRPFSPLLDHFRRWRTAWLTPAFAAALIAVAWTGWQVHSENRLAETNQSMAALRLLARLEPEVLRDFDLIQKVVDPMPAADLELLAALE